MSRQKVKWDAVVDENTPPQRFRWKTGLRWKFGALIWNASFECWECWFNGHFQQCIVPLYAHSSPATTFDWLFRELQDLERVKGFSALRLEMIDRDIF